MEVATSTPDIAQDDAGLLSLGDASEPRSLSQLVDLAARQVPACSGAAAILWRDGEPAVVIASPIVQEAYLGIAADQ